MGVGERHQHERRVIGMTDQTRTPDSLYFICGVPALNADWLTAVVYQTVYHGYDKTFYFVCSYYVGNQFIIAIRRLGGLWYMAKIPRLRSVRALRNTLCIRTALSCGILAIYHTPSCLIS